MPTVKPPKFSRPELLGKLKPSSLYDLFSPYRSYLGGRGFDLPGSPTSPLDVEALALVLATPTAATPADLCEELELLDILAEPQCVFDFEDNHAALVAKLRDDDDSPGDLALKILRMAPDDAWRAFDKKAEGAALHDVLPRRETAPRSESGTARQAGEAHVPVVRLE